MFSHFLSHGVSVYLQCLQTVSSQSNVVIQLTSYLEHQRCAEHDTRKRDNGPNEQDRAAHRLRTEDAQAASSPMQQFQMR